MIGPAALEIVKEVLFNTGTDFDPPFVQDAQEVLDFCAEDGVPEDEIVPTLILALGGQRILVTDDERLGLPPGSKLRWAADLVAAARTANGE